MLGIKLFIFTLKYFLKAHLTLVTCRLKALYDIRPRADEIEMITKYQQDNPKGKIQAGM